MGMKETRKLSTHGNFLTVPYPKNTGTVLTVLLSVHFCRVMLGQGQGYRFSFSDRDMHRHAYR